MKVYATSCKVPCSHKTTDCACVLSSDSIHRMENPAYTGTQTKEFHEDSGGRSDKKCCNRRVCFCVFGFLGLVILLCLGYTIYFFVTRCSIPTSPEYGSVEAGFLTAKFACNKDFVLTGNSTTDCIFLERRWSEPTPTCIPKCGVPIAPKYGTVFNEGLNASFDYNDGFKLVGESTLECFSNGTWSSQAPTCMLRCGPLSPPEHGTMSTEGSRVTFRCNIGFILLGAATTRCLNDGTWDKPVPTCNLRCEVPTAPNDGTVTANGSTLIFGCNESFSLVGASTAQCLNDGTWTNPAPTCSLKCRPLTPPNYGTLSGEGVTVTFRCDDGFSLVGASSSTCLDDGNWSNSPPTCRLSCSGPPKPQHGRVTVSGKIATFACNQGYHLSHTEKIICLKSGHWSSHSPTCNSQGNRETGNWKLILVCSLFVFKWITNMI